MVSATARIDQVKLSFLSWLAEEDQDRQESYRAYREYYDGDHDTQPTERQRRYLQIKIGEEFNCNLCPIVVDALAERLTVTGFEAGGQGALLWEWWEANGTDKIQNQVHTAAGRDGDGYLLVDWDNENARPGFTFELAYDGTEGVKLHYDSEHRQKPLFATKRWRIKQGPEAGEVRRLNLYYPDHFEKYESRGQGEESQWTRLPDEPWTAKDGSPLGVPLIHWRNRGQGYNYGQSELKSVIPLQNALNKSILDLLAAADVTGFRLFTMVGDDPSALTIVPGSWVFSMNPEVEIGAIEGANLDSLIKVKDSFAIDIGRVSRTPLSYFQISGHRPAEGTLKAEEAPLVGKAKDRMVPFGESWVDAIKMARRLWNAFGTGAQLSEDQIIETIWKDPESRNEKAHLETLKIKAELGVPVERLWIEMDYGANTAREFLNPGGAPEATFDCPGQKVAARAYCNLHGLWKAEG